MGVKIAAGVVAVILIVGYLLPPVFKLQEVALGVVICIGIAMMMVDLVQSMRKDD